MAINPHDPNQVQHLQETDPLETQEWLDALASVIENEGTERAHFLLEAMIDQARRSGSNLPYNRSEEHTSELQSR